MNRIYYRGYRLTQAPGGYWNVERRITVSWTGVTKYSWVWSYDSIEECKAMIDYHLGVK